MSSSTGAGRDPRTGEAHQEAHVQADPEAHEEVHAGGHGTSVAAWTSTIGVSLGFLVVAIFMIFWSVPMILVGVVIIVLSALAAPVLARAGYGEKTANREYTGGPRAVR